MLTEITTAGLPPPEQLPFWNETAARLVAPVRVRPLQPDAFDARIQSCRVRDLEIVSPTSSPADIVGIGGGDATGVLNLQLQHVGRITNHAGGRRSVLDEGDFVLYDPSQPLRLTFTERTQAVVLRLPAVHVGERLPKLRQMVGIKMCGRTGPAAIFSAFLRRAWEELETGDGEWAQSLYDVIRPMLDLAYASERVTSTEASRREDRRRGMFAVIDADLCDPRLDSRHIARAMGVSMRYVQALFAEMGTTPTAFIQRQRLELAARRIERDGANASITNIAFDVGFNDLSSFCRALRRRFAVSSREYRGGQRRQVELAA